MNILNHVLINCSDSDIELKDDVFIIRNETIPFFKVKIVNIKEDICGAWYEDNKCKITNCKKDLYLNLSNEPTKIIIHNADKNAKYIWYTYNCNLIKMLNNK